MSSALYQRREACPPCSTQVSPLYRIKPRVWVNLLKRCYAGKGPGTLFTSPQGDPLKSGKEENRSWSSEHREAATLSTLLQGKQDAAKPVWGLRLASKATATACLSGALLFWTQPSLTCTLHPQPGQMTPNSSNLEAPPSPSPPGVSPRAAPRCPQGAQWHYITLCRVYGVH